MHFYMQKEVLKEIYENYKVTDADEFIPLLKDLQVSLCNHIYVSEIFMFRKLPILDTKFFKFLIKRSVEIIKNLDEKELDKFLHTDSGFHPLDFNISQMNLPGIDDP